MSVVFHPSRVTFVYRCTYAEAMAADQRVAEMLRLNDDRNKAVSDMARLAYLLTHLGGGSGGGSGGRVGGDKRSRKGGENQGKMFRVRQALEASFVDEAEIVFTTLTSSSRRVFRQLTHGFDTVLIDEAGYPSVCTRALKAHARVSKVKTHLFDDSFTRERCLTALPWSWFQCVLGGGGFRV